ncbi:hypothetical protein GE09DRAFT_1271758 [Coniochaeta sp. 2T2.1]|nr:hypothetical protein GE09DRAFT_1271758 [Coniochaeta sp. 2T2.1]
MSSQQQSASADNSNTKSGTITGTISTPIAQMGRLSQTTPPPPSTDCPLPPTRPPPPPPQTGTATHTPRPYTSTRGYTIDRTAERDQSPSPPPRQPQPALPRSRPEGDGRDFGSDWRTNRDVIRAAATARPGQPTTPIPSSSQPARALPTNQSAEEACAAHEAAFWSVVGATGHSDDGQGVGQVRAREHYYKLGGAAAAPRRRSRIRQAVRRAATNVFRRGGAGGDGPAPPPPPPPQPRPLTAGGGGESRGRPAGRSLFGRPSTAGGAMASQPRLSSESWMARVAPRVEQNPRYGYTVTFAGGAAVPAETEGDREREERRRRRRSTTSKSPTTVAAPPNNRQYQAFSSSALLRPSFRSIQLSFPTPAPPFLTSNAARLPTPESFPALLIDVFKIKVQIQYYRLRWTIEDSLLLSPKGMLCMSVLTASKLTLVVAQGFRRGNARVSLCNSGWHSKRSFRLCLFAVFAALDAHGIWF